MKKVSYHSVSKSLMLDNENQLMIELSWFISPHGQEILVWLGYELIRRDRALISFSSLSSRVQFMK